jgi:hypothetical protein
MHDEWKIQKVIGESNREQARATPRDETSPFAGYGTGESPITWKSWLKYKELENFDLPDPAVVNGPDPSLLRRLPDSDDPVYWAEIEKKEAEQKKQESQKTEQRKK